MQVVLTSGWCVSPPLLLCGIIEALGSLNDALLTCAQPETVFHLWHLSLHWWLNASVEGMARSLSLAASTGC